MKTHSVRKFLSLLANGASIEKMQERGVLAKAYRFAGAKSGAEANDVTLITKDVGEAVRALRLESNVSEGDVMKAMGLDDVNEYVAWENGQATLEMTPENLAALAKVLKIDVPTLAAKMISADGPNPVLDEDGEPAADGGDPSGSGNQNTAPQTDSQPAKSATGNDGKQTQIQKSKLQGKSAQIFRIEDAPNVISKSADIEKAQRRAQLSKSILGVNDKAIAKGTIVAEDFAPNNVLDPQLGSELINVLVDQSEFLKQIQVRPMARQSQEVLVWDITGRKMGRQAPGWPSSADLQKGINKSKTLNATKCTLSWVLENRTMMNYQNNVPGLETEIFNGFTLALRNDMVDLSFNGQTDNWDTILAAGGTPAFTDLGIGYFKLAQNKVVSAQQISGVLSTDAFFDNTNHSTGNLVPLFVLKKMIQTAFKNSPRFFNSGTDFILGVTDWAAHEDYILSSQYAQATTLLTQGLELKYKGRPVTESNYITTGNYLHTQIKNYILGLVTGVQGNDGIVIERHIIPQGILFEAIVYLDFDFVNYDAIVVATA